MKYKLEITTGFSSGPVEPLYTATSWRSDCWAGREVSYVCMVVKTVIVRIEQTDKKVDEEGGNWRRKYLMMWNVIIRTGKVMEFSLLS